MCWNGMYFGNNSQFMAADGHEQSSAYLVS